MFKRLISIIVFIVSLFTSGLLYAGGWVDDWIDQKTSTAAGSFEGQKRGYFTGGSFSTRWQMSNDHLFTVESPRVRFGCGGLDVFMGGFAYLQPEFLVKKMQKILQASPAAALDLAINTMCEPCAKTMKSLEAITDTLNDLQINDCKASKVMTANILSAFDPDNAKLKAEADKSFGLNAGIFDIGNKVSDIWKAGGNKETTKTSDRTASCPADLKEILMPDNGSIIEAIMTKKGYPQDYIDLVRGLSGDVYSVKESTGEYSVIPVKPCDENDNTRLEDFLTGNVFKQDITGNCSKVTGTRANILNWVATNLVSIQSKMESKGTLVGDENTIMKLSPVPVMAALKMASEGKVGASVVDMSSQVIARGFAYLMMADLYNEMVKSVQSVKGLFAKKAQGNKVDCTIEDFVPIVNAIEPLLAYYQSLAIAVREDYAKSVGEISAIQNVSFNYERFNKIAREKLSRMFGSSVAGRAVGK